MASNGNRNNRNKKKQMSADDIQQLSNENTCNKTPSKPKVLNDRMTTQTKRMPSNHVTGHYSSNSKSSNYTWGVTQTPEWDRRLKKLHESGLLTKLQSIKLTRNVNECDDSDDNENRNANCGADLCRDNNGVANHCEAKCDEKPKYEFRYYDDFGPDNGDPLSVKGIKNEASKVPRDYYDEMMWKNPNGKLTQQNSQISFTGYRVMVTVNDPNVPSDDAKRDVYDARDGDDREIANDNDLGSQINNDGKGHVKSYSNMIQRDLNEYLPQWKKRFLIKPIDAQQNQTNDGIVLKSSSKSNKKSKRSKSSNARLSSSEGNLHRDDHTETPLKHVNNEHISSARRCQSNPHIVKALEQCLKKISRTPSSLASSASSDLLKDAGNSQIKVIKVNDKSYQILNCIGFGGSSKVYQVYDHASQTTMAIKIVDLTKADTITVAGYKNEINLLTKLKRCNRVVRMFDYEYRKSQNQLMVVMEKGDSDLAHVLKASNDDDSKKSLDSHLIKFYWKEMLKAVSQIHSMGVVHADLKPVNFILVSGKLKLIDFGIANAIKSEMTSVYKEHQIGTINYMAPEALRNRSETPGGKTVIKFNCKADVWSLGCILYNLVYGRTPFHHYSNVFEKAQAILNPQCKINYPPCDDEMLLDCMRICLQPNEKLRPSADELLNHRYLCQSLNRSKFTVNGRTFMGTNDAVSNAGADTEHLQLMSKINNLTPNRMKQLSHVVEQLTKCTKS